MGLVHSGSHRGRVRCAVLVGLVAAGLTWAAVAGASRPTTDAENAAISAAVVPDADPSCFTTRISTADESWALFSSAAHAASSCVAGGGYVVLHNAGGAWKDVLETSDVGACPLKGVPTPVALDLKICAKPGPKLYVLRGDKLVSKPKTLSQGAHGIYRKLHWTGWGTATAVGHGELFYEDAYDKMTIPIRITLTHRRLCGLQRTYFDLSAKPTKPTGKGQFFEGKIHLGCGYE
jgi:hypothetical protein